MTLEQLERELRAERPQPDPEFARRLDDWATAGFPRDRGLGPRTVPGPNRLRRAWAWLRMLAPPQVLAPVGAMATLIVVVAIAANSGGGTGLSGDSQSSSSSSGDASSAAEQSNTTKPATVDELQGPTETVAPAPIPDGGGGGGIARGTDARIVDASAQLTLGAEAGEVQEVANQVVEVTDRYGGVVLDSRVTTGEGGARAGFELEIPYARLDGALTDLSALADVVSRTEAGEDITARAVRAREQLAGTLDQVRAARIELIEADTREERLVIKSQIASLEAAADAQRAQLNDVKREGRFATVSVDVTSDGQAADEAGWSLGDALDDAGRVLEVIGGVAVVALAVALPLGLVGALAWLASTQARRLRRERALDA